MTRRDQMTPEELRGDFSRGIATLEKQVGVHVSFSDQFDEKQGMQYGACLLQIGPNGDGLFTCAYLNKTQLHELMVTISDAIGTFEGKVMGIDLNDIKLAGEA